MLEDPGRSGLRDIVGNWELHSLVQKEATDQKIEQLNLVLVRASVIERLPSRNFGTRRLVSIFYLPESYGVNAMTRPTPVQE